MLVWKEIGAECPAKNKEVLCQGSNGGVFFGKIVHSETEWVHGATVAPFLPTRMKNESQRGMRYAERWCDIEAPVDPVEPTVVENVVEREVVVNRGIELTESMCRNLAEFIDMYLFRAIREDTEIDNLDWLRDMVDAQSVLNQYADRHDKEA